MKDISTLIVQHGEGNYTLLMQGDDVTVSAFSHGYPHRPGNHVDLGLQGVTIENMTELATSILMSIGKQVDKKKKEAAKINADEPAAKDTNYDILMGAIQLAESNYDAEYDQLPEYKRMEYYNKAEEIIRNNRINAREDR